MHSDIETGGAKPAPAQTEYAPKGTVYLIGAGPGDPKLLTIRGMEILQKAECIVYDRLIGEELLGLAPAETERIYAGKADHHHTLPQEEINRILAEKAAQYSCIVRLKGGDPYVFGRGGEEGAYLRAQGIAFEEVPGISSAIAGLAYAGIPITHRGLATGFHVITAHDKRDRMTDIDFKALLNPKDTIVFLMGLSKVGEIARGLVSAGRDPLTPAAVISSATTPRQRTVTGTLSDIEEKVKEAGLPSPALIVIGDVVTMREKLSRDENLPLSGRQYLVTKVGDETSRLTVRLREAGAQVTEVTTGRIRYPEKLLTQEPARMLGTMDWAVFTSRHGVLAFMKALKAAQMDLRRLSHIRFAVIGAKTAEALAEYGIYADLISAAETGKALAEELRAELEREQDISQVVYFKAETAPDSLEAVLAPVCSYRTVAAYRNEAADIASQLTETAEKTERKHFDAAFFSCASSVDRLWDSVDAAALFGKNRTTMYAIGSSTAAALRRRGADEPVLPAKADLEAMAELEVNKWQNMPM